MKMHTLIPVISLLLPCAAAFAQSPSRSRPESFSTTALNADRRSFLASAAAAVVVAGSSSSSSSSIAQAAEEGGDLTSQLFNPDGSLKEEMETEAKFRTVELLWDASDQAAIVTQDGENSAKNNMAGSSIKVSYQLPEKWGSGGGSNDLYVDQSGGKACDRIIVYQAAGKADMNRLEKASITGIGKALDVTEDLSEIRTADLIGGRSTARPDGQKYFEFDLAVAPKTCDSSKEDLGLGFCPYETIYLLSSTVFDDRLYVFALQCNKSEWKRANSDLRRVRSSFSIQTV